MTVMRWLSARGLPLAAALVLAGLGASARAAEVKLQMRGGGFEISGELRSYDGARYTIESRSLGTMTLDASRFECVGAACPSAPLATPAALVKPALPKGQLGTTTWVGGSGIGTDFMPELVKSYAAATGLTVTQTVGSDPRNLEFRLADAAGHQVGQFNVHRQGVPAGLEALRQGTAELVWTSARVTEEEAEKMAASGLPALRSPGNEHVFAIDAMVILVSPENPAVSLSIDDVARIFAGKISDWSEVGLPPGKINVYAPVAGMGTWISFENAILKPRGLELTPNATRLKTAIEWSDRVAADPQGIGTNFIAYIRNAKALNLESSCGLISRPSVFAAKTEEYPMSRRLYFYTRGQPQTPLARELLAHALSPAVQPVLKTANFVDQEPETLEFGAQTSRIAYALNAQGEDFDMGMMRTLISEIKEARRLTLTFRFNTASFALDNKALADVNRLRALLDTPEYKSKTVYLIGFADAIGSFATNMKLAERRAAAVHKALLGNRAAGAVRGFVPRAYGELAPVACNDSDEARQYNRRVEVWLKD
jgi:phosphate transport system substrate-binding protein